MRGCVCAGFVVALSVIAVSAFEVDLAYVDDITALTAECYIRAIKLYAVDDPAAETAGETVLEGALELVEGSHVVRVLPAANEVRLWVDLDGAGTLTQMEWERALVDGTLLANVQLELAYSDDFRSPYRLFLMWNPFLPTVMTFCRNSYREGMLGLGDREVRVAVVDADTDGRYDFLEGGVLLIDVDGDGELLATGDSHERFLLDESFNVDGTSYEITAVAEDGSWMRTEESAESVAPKAPLLPGFAAPAFSWTDEAGETVSLEALRGTVVVLDFWAGWCTPCIAELPTLRQLVSEFGEAVTILGISLDRSVEAFESAVADHEIEWTQVYDGSDGPIGTLYRIEGIPMTYLIDRDGAIVARGLRGQRLLDAVAALAEQGVEDEGG
ncbi:TlpA family protein disulfide reductase [Candidatus Bipolaricaulota bacterium]